MKLFFIFFISLIASAKEITPRVIYGEDNRLDPFEVVHSDQLDWARSTALIAYDYELIQKGDRVELLSETFRERAGVCKTEPFYQQPSLGHCSAFLVAPDTVATAGHCIHTPGECKRTRIIFNFGYWEKDQPLNTVPTDAVYECKKIIARKLENTGIDYAIIKLDRKVIDQAPLSISQKKQPLLNTPLVVIGHPHGLPTKIAAGASVKEIKKGYFIANLDTYGGNSGSPVFNEETGEVEGILVRGERDYVYQGNCAVSHRCPQNLNDDRCKGEEVTLTSAFLSHIPTE